MGGHGRGAGRRGNSAAGRRGSPPGPGPSGRVQDRRRRDHPPGRLTAPVTCPGGRQLLARAPAWAAGVACPGSPPGIAAGSRGASRARAWAVMGAAGAAGDRRPQRGSMFLFHSALIVSAGDRRRGRGRVQGQRAAGWIAAGSRGRPCPGGRIISAGQQAAGAVSISTGGRGAARMGSAGRIALTHIRGNIKRA